VAGFSYKCPKCSHHGVSSQFSCFNCSGGIERLSIGGNREEIQCTKCGIGQVPNCPKCAALVTFKVTEKISFIPHVVVGGLAFIFLLMVLTSLSSNIAQVLISVGAGFIYLIYSIVKKK
jgi:hypothetical protein